MATEVIVPWLAGCPAREAALGWVLARWRELEVKVTVATIESAAWCKAAAVTPAVERSSADIVIVADADCWTDGITAAVDALKQGAGWAVPHGYVHRLDEPSTETVLAGGDPADGICSERPYKGFAGGGIVALHRTTYLDVPLDPRFHGWGQEDSSWALALATLAGGPWRGTDPLWHLWHPPQPRRSRSAGSDAGMALYRRYRSCRPSPVRMRQLIDTAKEATDDELRCSALDGRPVAG